MYHFDTTASTNRATAHSAVAGPGFSHRYWTRDHFGIIQRCQNGSRGDMGRQGRIASVDSKEHRRIRRPLFAVFSFCLPSSFIVNVSFNSV